MDLENNGLSTESKKSQRKPYLHQWFHYDSPHEHCSNAVGKTFESISDKNVFVKVEAVYPCIEYWKEGRQNEVGYSDIPSGLAHPSFVITAKSGSYKEKTFIMDARNFFEKFELCTVEM
ncbi:MAG: hypothetical protein KBC41_03150 [Candidatus Pacebacteria bacterium]|nr:hypothetical protein [Candidatus Paceibacterota bacterium]MBP9867045.1 hypothetical protein [Candidatus Paceibacterota bacterium]